jgi:cytochrome c553
MKPAKLAATIATAFALSAGAALGAQGETPKVIETLCSVCHGPEGNSSSPNFPRLAGQQASYIEAQLQAFKKHTRRDPDARDYMWGWAAQLDDNTIKAVAAYYAAQKPIPGESSAPQLMTKGKRIFETGIPSQSVPPCAACHGQEAAGLGTTPRLAGQHASYLVKQLKIFHSELRPAAVAMRTIVKGLTDEDMEAVAAYLQSK